MDILICGLNSHLLSTLDPDSMIYAKKFGAWKIGYFELDKIARLYQYRMWIVDGFWSLIQNINILGVNRWQKSGKRIKCG